MFVKLLKHEWKATRSTLGILALALLGMGLLATLDLRFLIAGIQNNTGENPFLALLFVAMGMFLLVCFIGLCAYGIGTQFFLLYRFYKNKFTDQGYLTFTLPVTTKQIYWSSFVHMLIWSLISTVIIVLVGLIFILFGTATDGLINLDALDVIGEFFISLLELPWELLFNSPEMIIAGIFYVLTLLIAPIYALVIPMACITIGAVLAKKHKILAAFGVYYALNAVVGIVSSVITMIPSIIIGFATQNEGTLYTVTMAISFLLSAGLTVAGYFMTLHLMKNKLNLP